MISKCVEGETILSADVSARVSLCPHSEGSRADEPRLGHKQTLPQSLAEGMFRAWMRKYFQWLQR